MAAVAKEVPELSEGCSYCVTKHSWKGKYRRILSIGPAGISTYNPEKFDLTNRWPHSDVLSAAPNKAGNVSSTFVLSEGHFVLIGLASVSALRISRPMNSRLWCGEIAKWTRSNCPRSFAVKS